MQHSLPIQRKKPNHLTHSPTILLFPLNTHLSLDNDCPRLSTFNQCILIWSNAETLLKVIIKRKTDEHSYAIASQEASERGDDRHTIVRPIEERGGWTWGTIVVVEI